MTVGKKGTSSKGALQTISLDRGIEVLTYLASMTFVKEKVVNGYMPYGSPAKQK